MQTPPTAPWVPKRVRFSDVMTGFQSARANPVPPITPPAAISSQGLPLTPLASTSSRIPPLMPLTPSRKFDQRTMTPAQVVATKRSPLAKTSNVIADADALATQLLFNRHMQSEVEKLRTFLDQVSKERDFYKMKLQINKGVENTDPNNGASGSGFNQKVSANAATIADASSSLATAAATAAAFATSVDVTTAAAGAATNDISNGNCDKATK